VQAALVVVVVRLALTVLPSRAVMRATLGLQRRPPRGDPRGERPTDRIAWAVRVVSRRVPGATCLTQALAAQALLARAGRPSHLQIGVRRDEQGAFRAHAWVEAEGRVIIGGGGLDRYTPLPHLSQLG
jgi:hypothetical protein